MQEAVVPSPISLQLPADEPSNAQFDSRATDGPCSEVSLKNEITKCTNDLTERVDSLVNAAISSAGPEVIEDERTGIELVDDEKAARTIQRAYKSYIARSALPHTTAPQTNRQHLFTRCLEMSRKMRHLHAFYRKLFLGPLPHLLLCLEGMRDYLHGEKKRIATRVQQVEGQELDEAMSELSRIMWVIIIPKAHSQFTPSKIAIQTDRPSSQIFGDQFSFALRMQHWRVATEGARCPELDARATGCHFHRMARRPGTGIERYSDGSRQLGKNVMQAWMIFATVAECALSHRSFR